MKPLSFKRHRFPAEVIRQAVWLHFRFSLSLRDEEELLAQRGIDITYETILLEEEVRPADRPAAKEAPAGALAALASRRNGLLDRRPADVSVARRR